MIAGRCGPNVYPVQHTHRLPLTAGVEHYVEAVPSLARCVPLPGRAESSPLAMRELAFNQLCQKVGAAGGRLVALALVSCRAGEK